MTMERVGDREVWLPDLDRFEGMAPYNRKDWRLSFIEAPPYNLVYGDAVMTTNR